MGTEVEHASGDIQTNVTSSSTTPTSGPKISMFAKKSGFVIPKNKLSGSLVPLYRGTKKGDADVMNEEATNQVVRKTKWGPDLTLNTTVRKGKALAYQTRINQISQQLTLVTLGFEGNDDSLSKSDHQLSKEESEMLELERREIIGELLRLNPTYKAPADYKPLLKEAIVPIPIKDYPGYNFLGLVFGPANDTQKRLEKETGAKIHVYGTMSDTGGKVEVTPSNEKEINDAYGDLYVHVSADTFEKIDAAVALIELLLTPVSMNPVSSSTTPISVPDNNTNTHQNTTSSSVVSPASINQQTSQTTQPYPGSLPLPQGQLPNYPQSWFPTRAPTYLQTPANSSSPFDRTTTMPSLFGPRPITAASFSPVLQNPSVFPNRPQNAMQPPYMQQAPPLGQPGGPRITPGPSLTGPPYNIRPVLSTSPITPPIVPSHGHNLMASQNTVVSRAPPMNIPNVIGPSFGPSQSEAARPAIQPSPIGPARPALPQAIRVPMPSHQSSALISMFGGQNTNSAKPSFNDFTFQPHNRPPNADSQVWQNNHQPALHNTRPPRAGPASLRPPDDFLNPSSVQNFPRVQINHPMAQIPPGPIPPGLIPPRHPIMPTHMQPRNFIPTQPMNNLSASFPPRPGAQMHNPENHLLPQQRFSGPRQFFGNYPGRPFSSSSGGQQVYDPFSPTSVPFNPQMGGKTRVNGESDPEYEDLMASVGVQ